MKWSFSERSMTTSPQNKSGTSDRNGRSHNLVFKKWMKTVTIQLIQMD